MLEPNRRRFSGDSWGMGVSREIQAGFEPLENRLLLSTYYIAATGSDSAAGNLTAPFASLTKFFNIARPGDTVYLRGGTYDASQAPWRNITPEVSGTASAPIIVSNMPGEQVIIDHKNPSVDNFIALYAGESYLEFRGLTVMNYLVGFNMQGGTPNHITLDNLDLHHFDVVGSTTGGRAIRMRGVDSITISNTDIHDIGGVGIVGIGSVRNVTIDGLTIHNIDDGNGAAGDGDGINITYADNTWADNITIRNTRVWDTSEDGIDIKANNVLLENDVVYNTGADGFKAWSVWATGYAQQGHFTVRNLVGWDAGQVVFEAFSLPVLTIENSTFVGAGEQTVLYKRPYNTEPWKGSVSIQNTVMEHLSGGAALAVNKTGNTLFSLQGNTYYSTSSSAVQVYTSSSATSSFSSAAMANGSFTSAMGTESDGSGTRVNVSPVVLFAEGAQPLAPGQSGSFAGLAVDPDGSSVTYIWTFGDGGTASGATSTHTYASNGTYTAALTATDSAGAAGSRDLGMVVGTGQADANQPPIAADLSRTTKHNNAVSGTVSASDPDGDSVTFAIAAQPAHGSVSLSANGAFTYTPAGGYVGADSFTFTARDSHNATDNGAVAFQVTNAAPIAPDVARNTRPATAVSGALAATDADGDPVTFARGAAPAHGSVSLNANGSYLYTPAAGYVGSDSFTFTASDGYGGSDTSSFTVQIANNVPTPEEQWVMASEDVALGGAVSATDADGDAVTYALAAAALHGTVTLNANGSFTYRPAANWYGNDSFTFTARDGWSTSAPATVTITVTSVNDLPTAQDLAIVGQEDTSIARSVVGQDIDGDALTFSVTTPPTAGTLAFQPGGSFVYTPAANWSGVDSFQFVASDGTGASAAHTVTITLNPVNDAPIAQGLALDSDAAGVAGTVTGTDIDGDALTFAKSTSPAHGTLTFNTDGSFFYLPAAGFAGSDSFTFIARDGLLNSAAATVTLNVTAANTAPVAYDLAVVTTNHAAAGTVLADDVDGDSVTFGLLTSPAHGSVVFNADGTFTYSGDGAWTGADAFTFCANDGQVDSAAATVMVTSGSTNTTPVATTGSFSTDENEPLAGSLSGVDADGDAIAFSLVADAGHGSVSLTADGSFTYTPDAYWHGNDSFTFRVSDGTADSAAATVAVRVNNVNYRPAKADRTVRASATVMAVSGAVVTTDPDGDALTYRVTSEPAYGALSVQADGSFIYTPTTPGVLTDSFTYIASDGAADSEPGVIILQLGNRLGFDGRSRVSFTDADGDTVTVSLVGPGTGYLLFDLAGNCDPSSLVLSGTDARSQVVIAVRGGETSIAGIEIDGSLAALAAGTTHLQGDLAATGSIGKLMLGDVSGADISLGGDLRMLRMGEASDVAITADHVGTVSATQWTGGELHADTLAAMTIARDLAADLAIANAASAVGAITVGGAATGGQWDVLGSVRSVTAGRFDGVSITAAQIGSITSRGDFSSTELTLTQGVARAATALGRLTVVGSLIGSTILSAGGVGAITVGAMEDTAVLLGLRAGYATDVNADGVLDSPEASDFADAPAARLASLTIRGGRGLSGSLFSNSNVAAGRIGRLSLRDVDVTNAGDAFGITADQSIESVLWMQGRDRYTWQRHLWPADAGDLVVQIV